LIHRFIARDEEKCERKGRKALGEILLRAASGSEDAAEADNEALVGNGRTRSRGAKVEIVKGKVRQSKKSVRCSPRGREMRRSVRMTM
jgi:hypothetical protein